MAATFRAFMAEYLQWRSDWLKLLGRLTFWDPLRSAEANNSNRSERLDSVVGNVFKPVLPYTEFSMYITGAGASGLQKLLLCVH